MGFGVPAHPLARAVQRVVAERLMSLVVPRATFRTYTWNSIGFAVPAVVVDSALART
jgi:hypothetical protein